MTQYYIHAWNSATQERAEYNERAHRYNPDWIVNISIDGVYWGVCHDYSLIDKMKGEVS